jgi:hypothetical protein
MRNSTQYAGKSESFVRKAAANEYAAMVAYGLNIMPTMYLRCDDGKAICLPYPDELDRMLKAGLAGPVPVTADSVISRFYRDTTPGGERGSHWHISKLPPPEFYEKITAAFRAFDTERKAKGWPEFICCPIDEVADDSTRLGLTLRSHGTPKRLFETRVDLGDRQRQWIPLRFSLGELIDRAGVGPEPWRSVSNVQLYIAESDYVHGTDLTFQFRDVQLLLFTSPTIQRVYAPAHITRPRDRLAVSFGALGTRHIRRGSHTITGALVSADGRTRSKQQQDLADGRVVILDTSTLAASSYRLDMKIVTADGAKCAHEIQPIEIINGPLANP